MQEMTTEEALSLAIGIIDRNFKMQMSGKDGNKEKEEFVKNHLREVNILLEILTDDLRKNAEGVVINSGEKLADWYLTL